jgi:hypothetical protein
MRNKCRNHKGELVDAPADLYQIVATYAECLIVWSRRGRLHRVRYGMQVNETHSARQASEWFGSNVAHFATCEGKLDGIRWE